MLQEESETMDKVEAYSILQKELEKYQNMKYFDLKQLIGQAITSEITAPSTKLYQIEIQAMWDDKENEDIRVIASIDDMSWFAFSPITESIIMQPNGSLL